MSRKEEIKHLLEKSRQMSVDKTYPITEGEVIEFISSSFEFGFVCGALSQKQQDQSTIELAEGYATPDQARSAVEIAREEIYKWLLNHNDYITVNGNITSYDMEKLVKDLKQAMKDE